MKSRLSIAFFGSSLVSSDWNGAATYFRGILRALAEHGHRITVYQPDAPENPVHRDILDPGWAEVIVYPASCPDDALAAAGRARGADLILKAGGNGALDPLLDLAVLDLKTSANLVAFWDVDAPATLDGVLENPDDPFGALIPRYDFVLTYGGGKPVVDAYEDLGALCCVPIYNALDVRTHFAAPPEPGFAGDLGFLGTRLPDREQRVDDFFFDAARRLPSRRFLLGGSGWAQQTLPANVRYLGDVPAEQHNAFNCGPLAVLNINRENMARCGFSPNARVFQAAGAGACLITDEWEGIELFLDPGDEVLVARDGEEVAAHLESLTPELAKALGRAAARRIRSEHTYAHRVAQLERLLEEGAVGAPLTMEARVG